MDRDSALKALELAGAHEVEIVFTKTRGGVRSFRGHLMTPPTDTHVALKNADTGNYRIIRLDSIRSITVRVPPAPQDGPEPASSGEKEL